MDTRINNLKNIINELQVSKENLDIAMQKAIDVCEIKKINAASEYHSIILFLKCMLADLVLKERKEYNEPPRY